MQQPVVPIPPAVFAAHDAWQFEVAYGAGSLVTTWRMTNGQKIQFLKVTRAGGEYDLAREVERLIWATQRMPVPQLIESGSDGKYQWMITEALPGQDATHEELRKTPEKLVEILAAGLRMIHDTPAPDCPFVVRVDDLVSAARHRVRNGLVDIDGLHRKQKGMSPVQVLEVLESLGNVEEDLVLCHGDYCLPNVIISEGTVAGFIDLGDLGQSDRWSDLAIATRSITWNLGPGWEDKFLKEYGVDPDPVRLQYFRLLYDLVR